ncbi:MAG TPA: hypothetical protein VHO03_10880 [Ignavibacteriales bacterium]|nr:hypothetical protein [Ignavibacteriales bacterium]
MRYVLIIFLFVNTIVSAEKKSYALTDIRNTRKFTLTIEEDLVDEVMKLVLYEKKKVIDSLQVPYVKYITNITESQRSFLKVEFRRGGSSGVKMRFTSIFCAADSKIVPSLTQISTIYSHITKTFIPKYDSIKGVKYHEDYSIYYNLLKSGREYSVKVNDSYFLKSIFESDINEKWTNRLNLKFDKEQFIFYSEKRKVKGHFQIYYLNDSEESKELNGEFWAIEMKRFTYLWINSRWFYIARNKLNEI